MGPARPGSLTRRRPAGDPAAPSPGPPRRRWPPTGRPTCSRGSRPSRPGAAGTTPGPRSPCRRRPAPRFVGPAAPARAWTAGPPGPAAGGRRRRRTCRRACTCRTGIRWPAGTRARTPRSCSRGQVEQRRRALLGLAVEAVVDHLQHVGVELGRAGGLGVAAARPRARRCRSSCRRSGPCRPAPASGARRGRPASKNSSSRTLWYWSRSMRSVRRARSDFSTWGRDVLGGPLVGAVEGAVEDVAELGGDDPAVAVAADGVADERLGRVVAVALGRVDQVHAPAAGGVEDGVDRRLVELLAPLAAVLPGADADDGDGQAGLAEAAVLHSAY